MASATRVGNMGLLRQSERVNILLKRYNFLIKSVKFVCYFAQKQQRAPKRGLPPLIVPQFNQPTLFKQNNYHNLTTETLDVIFESPKQPTAITKNFISKAQKI